MKIIKLTDCQAVNFDPVVDSIWINSDLPRKAKIDFPNFDDIKDETIVYSKLKSLGFSRIDIEEVCYGGNH